MADNMQQSPPGKSKPTDPRTKLAFIVTWFSIGTVGVVAVAIVLGGAFGQGANTLQGAQLVLTGILPLLGTWVGTILAYYFSIANFEAAAASERMRMEIQQEKTSVSALTVSRKRGKMVVGRMPRSSVILAPGKSIFEERAVQRLPVLDAENRPHYVVHKSSVAEFCTSAGLTDDELSALTLETLGTNDPELLKLFSDSFATIAQTANVVDAKRALGSIPNCQDVFVTEDGTRNSAVLGWLTESRIVENLGE